MESQDQLAEVTKIVKAKLEFGVHSIVFCLSMGRPSPPTPTCCGSNGP
jgi:hypothetical protein